MGEMFRIRLRRGDHELEIESSSREFVEEKIEIYLATLPKGTPEAMGSARELTGRTTHERLGENSRPISLREFAKLVGPDKKTEIAATIAYFLEHYAEELLADWKPSEVSGRFTELRESPPTNPAMTIGSSDFFMHSSSAGRYKLSSTGVAWIESKLPGHV